jgi:hypothetical protein
MYFVFIYENRRMKLVESVLRRGKGMREKIEGAILTKMYYKCISKYHNVYPGTTTIC